jgi:ribosomal protein S19
MTLNMSRSKWKGPFVEKSLVVANLTSDNNLNIKTLSRKTTILPFFIGKELKIHSVSLRD